MDAFNLTEFGNYGLLLAGTGYLLKIVQGFIVAIKDKKGTDNSHGEVEKLEADVRKQLCAFEQFKVEVVQRLATLEQAVRDLTDKIRLNH
jgi:hypothetical protein